MPGVYGVVHVGAREDEIRARLGRQRAVLARPGNTVGEWAADGIGLGHADIGVFRHGPQPAASADGRHVLVLDGEIYNLRELLGRDALVPGGAAAQCLALLCRDGLAAVPKLAGLFTIVFHDRVTGEVHVATDRFGFRTLFFRAAPGGLVFASEIKGVLAGLPAGTEVGIDRRATFQLLALGSHFASSTWLEGVRRVAPATVYSLQPDGRLLERTYWEYRYDEDARPEDAQTCVTVAAKLLDRAVERAMSGAGRPGLFLSGGYDSRAIAAAIRPHHSPVAFTFGRPDSRDAIIAPRLAERLGFPHHRLENSPGYLGRLCREIVWRTEGVIAFHRVTSLQHHDFIARHADVVTLGFLGEMWGSHTWPRLLLARNREEVVEAHLAHLAGARLALLRRVMPPAAFDEGLSGLREDLARTFAQVQNDRPLNIADAWRMRFLHPRTSYHSPAVDRPRIEVRAPQLDYDLTAFLQTIRPLARHEQRIYKKMIYHAYPQVRDIPCANSMRPIDPLFLREFGRFAAEYAWRKASTPVRALFGREDRLGREITDFGSDFRGDARLWDEVLDPLKSGDLLPALGIERDGYAALATEHRAGRADHEEFLASIASLAVSQAQLLLNEMLPDGGQGTHDHAE